MCFMETIPEGAEGKADAVPIAWRQSCEGKDPFVKPWLPLRRLRKASGMIVKEGPSTHVLAVFAGCRRRGPVLGSAPFVGPALGVGNDGGRIT